MAREDALTKGRRYAAEGRLVVESVVRGCISARCRGAGRSYSLGWSAGHGWYCDCPAKTTCAHLACLQLVVVIPPESPTGRNP